MSENDRSQFERKITENYAAFKASWLKMSPAALIDQADEIAVIQRMAAELPGCVSDEDIAYLLRFKNPLEVVSDQWQEENGPETNVDEEMSHVLWNIRDKQDAEQLYAMEPEYYDTDPQLSM